MIETVWRILVYPGDEFKALYFTVVNSRGTVDPIPKLSHLIECGSLLITNVTSFLVAKLSFLVSSIS